MIRTIKPEAANIRTNAGKVIAPSPVIVTEDGYKPSVQRLRTNAGKSIATTPSVVTETVYQPLFQAIRKNAGKSVTTFISEKQSIQNRLLCLYPLSDLNKAMGASSIGTLTAVNSPTTTTGKLGSCYLFNRASNQKIHDPSNLLQLSKFDQFTIGCWFYSTDNNTYAPPVSLGRDSLGAFELHGNRVINTNTIQWYISTDGTTNKVVSWTGFVINTWFFILIEYSKKLGRLALYVDNVLQSENLTVSTSANIVENTERGLTFGSYARDLNNTSFHFNGLIDESFVAIGNTTQAERDWLWNNGNGNTLV